jgi:branched-chain amino acid aminotransferase
MGYLWHNGDFISDDGKAIPISNRAFQYGDGFFESIRVINGKPCFLNHHFLRTVDTAKALQLNPPDDFSVELLEEQIVKLLKKNRIKNSARVRITFYRESDGNYLPLNNDMGYVMELRKIPEDHFVLNDVGRTLDVYPDLRKDINQLSIYKTLNCAIYIMASLYARSKNLDDALIQNNRQTIVEATSTNVFLVSNGVLYTPSLDDGCVAGTMRMNIINIALDNDIKVYECSLTPQNLLIADEIFLTNAVQGVQWVSSYRTKRYFNDMARRMVNYLNEMVNNQ